MVAPRLEDRHCLKPKTYPVSRLADELKYVGNHRPCRRRVRVALLALFSIVLTSCNSATFSTDDRNDVDVMDKVRSLDLLPRTPKQVGNEAPPQGKRAQ